MPRLNDPNEFGRDPLTPNPAVEETRTGPVGLGAAILATILIVALFMYGVSQTTHQPTAAGPASPPAASVPETTGQGPTGPGTTGQGATNPMRPNPQEQDPIEQNTRP